MKQRFSTVIVGGLMIFLLLSQPTVNSQSGPDTSLMGFSVGDTFTYVLDELQSSFGDYQVAYDYPTKQWLEIPEKGEFNITIKDTTFFKASFGDSINATYTNGTFVADSTFYFTPAHWALFTDWDFYEVNITDWLDLKTTEGIVAGYNLTNGAKQFELEVKYNATYLIYDYQHNIFNKTTGMLLYSHVFKTFNDGDFYLAKVRQKGYVLASEQPVVTNSTSSSTFSETSSTSNLSSTTSLPVTSNTSSSTLSSSSSDGSAFIPGFGAILSFTGLITVFTAIRYKKH